KGADGFQTLLALTDGDDSEYRNDPEAAADRLWREFRGTDIFVNVVLFQPTEEERKTARAQFGVIEKLPRRRGLLLEPKDKNELADVRRRAMLPGLRLFKDREPAAEAPPEGFPVAFPRRGREGNLFWSPLTPGAYDALFYKKSRQPLQHLQLRA